MKKSFLRFAIIAVTLLGFTSPMWAQAPLDIYDRAEYFGNVNNKITFTVVDFHSVKCPTPVSGTFELPAVVPF